MARLKTILLTNHYTSGPRRIVEEKLPEGFELKMLDQNKEERLISMIPEADYLLASGRVKITAEALAAASRLQMIQRTGVGLDSLDLVAIKARGIPLYVNQGVNAQSVAEHAILLMLACLRRLPQIHRKTAGGVWEKQAQGVQTAELAGKTVGLIGLGSIGRKVASILRAFGVKTVYYDLFRADEAMERELGLTFLQLQELAGCADIISLHCPLTKENTGLIDREFIASMKNGAILINTARGGLVDFAALREALASGKLSFAGLDVFPKEPVPADEPILRMENVIVTPHIGGITEDSFRRMMTDAMRNIQCFECGKLDEIAAARYL